MCTMLPMSLDCSFLITPSVFSNVYLCCVLCAQCFQCLDCSFLITSSVFFNVYLSCVLCAQCFQCLWIVHSWLPHRFSLTFICAVSCAPNVSSVWIVLDCSFLITSLVVSNVYLSCVLCAQCCRCLWIVHSWLPHRLSLTFICPVSCVPNVASVSGLFILDYPIGFL